MEKNKKKLFFTLPIAIFTLFLIIFFSSAFPGIIRADEITDSDTISVTAVVPPKNTVIFSGKACPFCRVYLEQDGAPVDSDVCNGSAEFQITLENMQAGTYLFELYAIDTDSIHSSISASTITISHGTLTSVSNILLSPTLQTDESAVIEGKKITFFGQTVPNGAVTILIDDSSPFIQVSAASDGGFYYEFKSSSLSAGSHFAEARVTLGGIISPYSLPAEFEVEEKDAEENTCVKADYDGDNKVSLVDFSILLYWYGKNNVSDEIDLSGDNKANLKDFSILMHCWDE